MNIERKNLGQDKDGVVDGAVRAIREVRVPEGPPAEVVESVLAAGNREQNEFQKRRFKMSRIMKIEAVILIVVGIGTGIVWFAKGTTSVAWAQVARQLETAQAYSHQVTINMDGQPEITGHITFSPEHGLKMETIANGVTAYKLYANPREKYTIIVMPQMKMYTRSETPAMDGMQRQSYDPRYLFKQIMECEYVELGRKVINGVEVKGIETTDPNFDGGRYKDILVSLWVDSKTGWPVMMEMISTKNSTGGQSSKMHVVADEYQWNIDVDPTQFQPDIPEDYIDGNPTIDFKNGP